jgi:hypothetical protein
LQLGKTLLSGNRHFVLRESFIVPRPGRTAADQLRRIRGRIRQVSQTPDLTRVTPPVRRITTSRRDSHHEPARPTPSRTSIHTSAIAQASQSVASEPAYSRLRSELASRRRGASEEPEDGGVMRALRGALGDR